jgi:hypothetical protein
LGWNIETWKPQLNTSLIFFVLLIPGPKKKGTTRNKLPSYGLIGWQTMLPGSVVGIAAGYMPMECPLV